MRTALTCTTSSASSGLHIHLTSDHVPLLLFTTTGAADRATCPVAFAAAQPALMPDTDGSSSCTGYSTSCPTASKQLPSACSS